MPGFTRRGTAEPQNRKGETAFQWLFCLNEAASLYLCSKIDTHNFSICPLSIVSLTLTSINVHGVAETWRRVWGDGNFFFRGPGFLNDVFSKKIPFLTAKISDDLFFSYRPGFPNFTFLFPDFPYLYYMLNVVYDPFLTRRTPFFTLFILSRASDNTPSQNIGRTDAWAVPHFKFWGTVPPQSPQVSAPVYMYVAVYALRLYYNSLKENKYYLTLRFSFSFSSA